MFLVGSGFKTSQQDLVEYAGIVLNVKDLVAGGK